MLGPGRRPGAVASILLVCASVTLAACGGTTSSSNQLTVGISAADSGSTSVAAGDTPSYTVTVVNNGPGSVDGLTLQVALPAGFKYMSTSLISGKDQARTQSNEAAINSPTPQWGTWSLPPPVTNADGTVAKSEVDVTFLARADGAPGTYSLTATVSSDSTDGLIQSKPLAVTLNAAPQLAVNLGASPGNIHPGGAVTYHLTITNQGSGEADNVGVLLVLPSGFEFQSTSGVAGNSAEAGRTDPIKNASLVHYGGFNIPARGPGGPGVLAITFTALVVPGTAAGNYPTSGEVTDAAGLVITIANTVPVNVAPS